MKLSSRFAALMWLFFVALIGYVGWSFMVLNEIKIGGPLYQRISQTKDLVQDILPPPQYIIESYLVTLQAADSKDKEQQQRLIARLTALKKDYDARHQFWSAGGLDPEIGALLLQQAHEPALRFYATTFNEFIPALQRNDRNAVQAAQAKMTRDYELHRAVIDQLVIQANRKNDIREQQAQHQIRNSTSLVLVLLLFFLFVGIPVLNFLIRREVIQPLIALRDPIKQLAEGDLNITVPYSERPDEIGDISRGILSLQAASAQLEMRRWVKVKVINLATELQRIRRFEEFSQVLLTHMHKLLSVEQAGFYRYDEQTAKLQQQAYKGLTHQVDGSRSVSLGEGLLGQCAQSKAVIELRQRPVENQLVAAPACIVLRPLLLNDRLLGVLELPSAQPLGDKEKMLLDELVPIVAMNLEILTRHLNTQQLLAASLQQSEALSASELQLKARTAELEEIEAWYHSIIELAPDGLLVADKDGTITLCNSKLEQMFGYTAGELVGNNVAILMPMGEQTTSAYLLDWLEKNEASDSNQVQELSGRRKNGAALMVELGLSRLPARGQRADTVCLSLRDISLRKQAEETLRDGLKMAEEATRMKSSFLANMSHEIRTPMNAIIGMTRLALQTELSERQRNFMEKIDSAAKGLLGILNDILDFSKIEAGKLSFELKDFRLSDVLDHCANLTFVREQEKQVELLFDIAPDVPSALVGDGFRLGQVLLNLLSNALKFTEHGEITLRIRCLEQSSDNARLRFEVKDTGIGMTRQQCDNLFAPFMQADSSTTRVYGGSGLGLSISKKLVEMMDGRIWVESEIGQGSCFIFTAHFGLSRAEPQENTLSTTNLQGMRVLVVDDNASSRDILLGILDSLKMSGKAFDNALDGLTELEAAQLRGAPYQMVLMDWHMPEVDGVEAVRRIRANTQIAKTLTVVMVTAYGREEVLEKTKDIQIEGLLEKPISSSSLLEAILRSAGHAIPASARRIQRQANCEAAEATLRGAYVLMVEDNLTNQELATDILQGLGIRVDVVSNGAQALEQVGKAKYDAVLMDCQMPVMDGFEATARIRLNPQFEKLPILAMTANAMQGDQKKCLAAGMNDHIAKPIDIDELVLTMARWIKPAATPAVTANGGAVAGSPAPLQLPGVDTALALKRIGGDAVRYQKLLTMFRQGQADSIVRIRQALQNKDNGTALLLIHTLKGLAATVGAGNLNSAANALEHALHHPHDADLEQLLAKVEAPLKQLLSAIGQVLSPAPDMTPPANGAAELDMAALTQSLRRLATLLKKSASLAIKETAPIAALLDGHATAPAFQRISALTEQYEFDSALVQLQQLAIDIGIELENTGKIASLAD